MSRTPESGDADGVPATAPIEVLRAALDAMEDHVTLLDPQGRLLHVNQAWEAFAAANGWAGGPWVGMDYLAATDIADDADAQRVADGLRQVLDGEVEQFRCEYPCHAPDELRWFDMRASPLPVEGVGALIVHVDITQRRLAERALEHAASHDDLTGLANRRLLQARLAEALTVERAGVIAVRLHGPAPTDPLPPGPLTDDVLRETSLVLDQLFSPPATAGRYGLDQFAVVLPGAGPEALERSALALEAGLRAKLAAGGRAGATVGTAFAEPGEHARGVMARAALDARAGAVQRVPGLERALPPVQPEGPARLTLAPPPIAELALDGGEGPLDQAATAGERQAPEPDPEPPAA
ncbi:sensor domain-containing diguanylate cyclase [Patulibacter sp. SYSU D01012]|uniref:GGDEF domain-containing protein n=1 Tax=Patulibacter sp. SYSU D01012 TaxID=2817381 RepID=UPI001B3082BF|nr:sensor domain-containing diguanylate cyclase [Patulibacter sp. SYSU D01012]